MAAVFLILLMVDGFLLGSVQNRLLRALCWVGPPIFLLVYLMTGQNPRLSSEAGEVQLVRFLLAVSLLGGFVAGRRWAARREGRGRTS